MKVKSLIVLVLLLSLFLQSCGDSKFDEIQLNSIKDNEVYINEDFQSFLKQTEKWRLKSLVKKIARE